MTFQLPNTSLPAKARQRANGSRSLAYLALGLVLLYNVFLVILGIVVAFSARYDRRLPGPFYRVKPIYRV